MAGIGWPHRRSLVPHIGVFTRMIQGQSAEQGIRSMKLDSTDLLCICVNDWLVICANAQGGLRGPALSSSTAKTSLRVRAPPASVHGSERSPTGRGTARSYPPWG